MKDELTFYGNKHKITFIFILLCPLGNTFPLFLLKKHDYAYKK